MIVASPFHWRWATRCSPSYGHECIVRGVYSRQDDAAARRDPRSRRIGGKVNAGLGLDSHHHLDRASPRWRLRLPRTKVGFAPRAGGTAAPTLTRSPSTVETRARQPVPLTSNRQSAPVGIGPVVREASAPARGKSYRRISGSGRLHRHQRREELEMATEEDRQDERDRMGNDPLHAPPATELVEEKPVYQHGIRTQRRKERRGSNRRRHREDACRPEPQSEGAAEAAPPSPVIPYAAISRSSSPASLTNETSRRSSAVPHRVARPVPTRIPSESSCRRRVRHGNVGVRRTRASCATRQPRSAMTSPPFQFPHLPRRQ
jgi:hypothetical protein